MNEHPFGVILMAILTWVFVALIGCLFGLLAWNYVISPTFSCPTFNFGQMLILTIAIRSLFGVSTTYKD